ncbi:MAG: choice-of-anchor P family protein, partial [Mycobacteriales bacterium]
SRPASGQTSGGRYAADVTVTMIHVTTLLGTDVAVARAVAHAEFPQLTLCGSPTSASVSGNALVAGEDTVPSLVPVLAGFVEIPPSGGSQSAQLATFALPADSSAVSGSAADSSTSGSLTPTPGAQSLADVTQGVCLLPDATRISTSNPRGCLVRADLVRSQVASSATGTAASSSDTGTQLTNVVVDGLPAVAGTPPPNTVLLLPGGLGSVVLDEHVCTGGGTWSAANPTCAGTTATGLTVTALHVVLVAGTLAGVEVRVASAHSDAELG